MAGRDFDKAKRPRVHQIDYELGRHLEDDTRTDYQKRWEHMSDDERAAAKERAAARMQKKSLAPRSKRRWPPDVSKWSQRRGQYWQSLIASMRSSKLVSILFNRDLIPTVNDLRHP